ncbi:MAG: zinc ribbon domain-containing protein [Ruminococcus sp.]|nr:zinc ribbon domain-containing protein [Ruminococcus sp.]
MIYCRKCGNQMPDDSVFCSKCGCNQNDSIGNSASPSEESFHPNINNENSIYFGYSERKLKQNIILIIAVIISTSFLILILNSQISEMEIRSYMYKTKISKLETIRSLIVFFDILYTALMIWSSIRLKKVYLRINGNSISGTAFGTLTNTDIRNLSIKNIKSMELQNEKFMYDLLTIKADKPYVFFIENAEKAHMELHKKMHNN